MMDAHKERRDSGYCSGVKEESIIGKENRNYKEMDVAGGIEKLINLIKKQADQISKLEQENKSQNVKISQLVKENEDKDRLIAELKLQVVSLERNNDILKRSSKVYPYFEEQELE